MALSTFSAFYFGIEIDSTNQNLNFDEGGGELSAVIEPNTYSLTDFLVAIKTALDAASTLPQEYTVTVDRDTRQITISSVGAFDLLVLTGSQLGSSPWTIMGFTGGADLTGLTTYTGASGAGSEYITQFALQDYVESQDDQERLDASVNESASGAVEVISFGIKKIFNMSFMFITDKPQDGKVIRNNSTGRADARAFFLEITKRGALEFMPDIADRSTFFEVVLESLPGNTKGVGFKLKELTGQSLPDYYEIKNVKMREV
jgi:hypothetical protein